MVQLSGVRTLSDERVVLNKTSRIKNMKSHCIIVANQMREFSLVNTINSVDDTKPPRLLPSHTTKEICNDDP